MDRAVAGPGRRWQRSGARSGWVGGASVSLGRSYCPKLRYRPLYHANYGAMPKTDLCRTCSRGGSLARCLESDHGVDQR